MQEDLRAPVLWESQCAACLLLERKVVYTLTCYFGSLCTGIAKTSSSI